MYRDLAVTNDVRLGAVRERVASAILRVCFVQVGGLNIVALLTDAGVEAGEYLTCHATANGQCDTMAAGTEEQVWGMALAADSSSALAAGACMMKGLI